MFAVFVVSGVYNNPVPEMQCLARFKRAGVVEGGITLERAHAEDVGGKKPVAAYVPISRMPWIRGVIKDSDSQLFSLHFAERVHPISAFSPAVRLALLPI